MSDPCQNTAASEMALCRVEALVKHFPIRRGFFQKQVGAIRAVDGVFLEVFAGETLGLVGESGSGKSTIGRAMLHLDPPTDGRVWFDNRELASLGPDDLRQTRQDMQMIFQDPYASLNPRMRVGAIIREPLDIHEIGDKDLREAAVIELLEMVGLSAEHARRYPHEFSGGQRQRIGIARALATRPKFIVADEPISALDVSIQAQIVNLLADLKDELGLTYVFIAHDLSMVRHLCDRVAVMYLGRIVETGRCEDVFANPLHPYTQALISAVPVPDPDERTINQKITAPGDMPSPSAPPTGCRFHTRCPVATDLCHREDPETRDLGTAVAPHEVACHFTDNIYKPDQELKES